MRLVFAGTPDFAVPSLQALAAAGHDIAAVYTQPDRVAGRGRKLSASPVKQAAVELGFPLEQPASLRGADAAARLADHAADFMIVAAYGLILPPAILQAPSRGCLNVHASLLPRWRGAAPIQRAIEAGDAQTGITIMRMEAGLDTGPMLLKQACPIRSDDTAGSLHDRLAAMGAEAVVETLSRLDRTEIPGEPQDDSLASYATKLEKAEAWIDWRRPAVEIERRIRAFNPWPVAQSELAGEAIRIWSAVVLDRTSTATPGQVIAADRQGIVVSCGQGNLRITRVQMPGRRQIDAGDLANARALQGLIFTAPASR